MGNAGHLLQTTLAASQSLPTDAARRRMMVCLGRAFGTDGWAPILGHHWDGVALWGTAAAPLPVRG